MMFYVNKYNELMYQGKKPKTVKEALFLSIKKWEYLLDYLAKYKKSVKFPEVYDWMPDAKSESCGLCMMFIDREGNGQEHCYGCPISIKTQNTECHGTSYYDYVDAMTKQQYRLAINEMLKFLNKLQKDYGFE